MSDDLRQYARGSAQRVGIDPVNFERQINQESGFNPNARNAASGADGIAQIVVRWHPAMAGKTRDPYASLDYAADLMRNHLAVHSGDWALALSAYNAGPGATMQGLAGTLSGWPYAETVRYVANILQISQDEAVRRLTGAASMVVQFNPNEPNLQQNDSWSCAPTSARWALKALGRNPSESWIEDQMIAEGVVSKDDGLLDASGAGLAAFLVRHYGEYGYDANNEPSVSFDWCALEGDHAYPVLIGGRNWNHWAVLKGYDPSTGPLLLMNPSLGWMGVQHTMNRQQFDRLGPFSAVRLFHPDLFAAPPAPPPPTPEPPKPLTRAEWKAGLLEWIDRMPME